MSKGSAAMQKIKYDRMKKVEEATRKSLEVLLGNDIFFTINEVAKILKISRSKVYEMKILEGQENLTNTYRIVFKVNKGGKLVCTRDELLKAIDFYGYID